VYDWIWLNLFERLGSGPKGSDLCGSLLGHYGGQMLFLYCSIIGYGVLSDSLVVVTRQRQRHLIRRNQSWFLSNL